MGVGVLGRQFAGGAKFGQSFLLLQHQKAPSLRADGAQTWRWVQVSLLHLEPTTSQIFNSSLLQHPDSGLMQSHLRATLRRLPLDRLPSMTVCHGQIALNCSTLPNGRRHQTWSQQNRTTQNIFPCAGFWPNETIHFTPWLAENLSELAAELRVELQLTQTEAYGYGGYTDILAEVAGAAKWSSRTSWNCPTTTTSSGWSAMRPTTTPRF